MYMYGFHSKQSQSGWHIQDRLLQCLTWTKLADCCSKTRVCVSWMMRVDQDYMHSCLYHILHEWACGTGKSGVVLVYPHHPRYTHSGFGTTICQFRPRQTSQNSVLHVSLVLFWVWSPKKTFYAHQIRYHTQRDNQLVSTKLASHRIACHRSNATLSFPCTHTKKYNKAGIAHHIVKAIHVIVPNVPIPCHKSQKHHRKITDVPFYCFSQDRSFIWTLRNFTTFNPVCGTGKGSVLVYPHHPRYTHAGFDLAVV